MPKGAHYTGGPGRVKCRRLHLEPPRATGKTGHSRMNLTDAHKQQITVRLDQTSMTREQLDWLRAVIEWQMKQFNSTEENTTPTRPKPAD